MWLLLNKLSKEMCHIQLPSVYIMKKRVKEYFYAADRIFIHADCLSFTEITGCLFLGNQMLRSVIQK